MAEIEVTLATGIKIGDGYLKRVVISEAKAKHYFAALEKSEKLEHVNDGKGQLVPDYVSSPALMAQHMLAQQIKSIDDLSGPLDVDQLDELTITDLNLLMDAQESLQQAANNALKEVANRGRSDTGSESS